MDILMIGAGMVAQTHVLALRDNTVGARLVGVLGRDAERTRTFCAGASKTLGYEVAALATLDTDADGAILITPPDARLEYARSLVAAGVPTLMEKPVERTLGAARGIVDLYAEADVPLAFCFQHRTRKAAQTLKAKLDEGALGDIVHIEMRVPWWREQAYYDAPGRGTYARDGGGVMINQAIHTLDLGLWLAGRVVALQAMMHTSPLHRMEAEDIAAALLTFRSGATGVLSATTTAYPGEAESITVTTTKARAHLEGDSLRIDWLTGEREDLSPEGAGDTGGGADPMAFTHAWHQSILEDFVTSVEKGRPPIAPPTGALHVHAVIDAMERAARSGTTVEVVQ
ncbi:Gfo/Idh/MocA family oxidoreductase [Tateyamaria omphalii]|uniref:Gfo/Idh/MocA family protein n=1 Tax=Tateyamaria omphalii TaxID=299262 RepID=UPI001C9929DB|nr:Gfo/Idh/MocA family oxidoreductase [Tateyamaria omphalii]MBY5933703.1 Gfo/Idh/MocA family oxidoreductase [Tateyamaria omphalii]